MEDAQAYWIFPDGKVFSDFFRHIQAVCAAPGDFGLTKEEVNAVYAKYGEPVGCEKHARIEIMEGLIRRGWIRIRYRPQNDYYVIELASLDKNGAMRRLSVWARNLIEANRARKFSDVQVIQFDDNMEMRQFTVEELVKGE